MCEAYFCSLNASLLSLPEPTEKQTLYRYVSIEASMDIDDVLDMSFASCSSSEVACREAFSNQKNQILLILHDVDPQDCREISQFSNYENEKEVMILRNCSFRITEIQVNPAKVDEHRTIHVYKV